MSVPPLPAGTYIVFGEVTVLHPWSKKKIFAYDFINVTNLAMIESEFRGNERLQVVDRNTGSPISGATVDMVADSSGNRPGLNKHLITDKEGFVEIKRTRGYVTDITTTITYQGDRLQTGNYQLYPQYRDRDVEDEYDLSASLFTDRSIYRPGQTVYFKGILLKIKNAKSSIVTNKWVKVILKDVNYKEAASLRLKTNAFGSFAGEFKLPATGLTGEYTIGAEEDDEDEDDFYLDANSFYEGEVDISVEEYKRPTFETSFKPVKQTFRPNEKVIVSGVADAFNGAKISRAKVSYRVRRTSSFPYWDWRSPRYYGENEEIVHGDTITNINGEFQISFKAVPDEKSSAGSKTDFQL